MKKNLQTPFSTRQYMLSEDFEIYYYSDHYVTKVEDHSHGYYEFYFFLEGDIQMHIGDTQYFLKPGDMVLIPPKIGHHAEILNQGKPYRRFVFWISEGYCNRLLSISPNYVYLMQHVLIRGQYIFHNDVITFNAIQSKVFQLIEEIHSKRFGREAKISLCVNDLLLHLNRVVYEQNHVERHGEGGNLYQSLTGFIEEHLDEDLSLDRLAGELYVSKYYIAHAFKENMGLSIHQYIMKKRLIACREAIAGNIAISEAYLMFGFKDYSSFYRAFKKEYGISPKEYKDMQLTVEQLHEEGRRKGC